VRSDIVERGSAEPPSSLFVLLEDEDERSLVTLPESFAAPGAGTLTLPEALPLALGAGAGEALPDEALELDLSAGADEALDEELDPG
jgi:hypothetical protein